MIDSRAAKLLGELTRVVLDSRRPASSLRREVAEMTAILARAGPTRLSPQVDGPRSATATPNGLALSPVQAAACAGDVARTVQFLRGTHAAIADARERNPQRPARVLYAGCGPYATLAVPLMTILSPEEVRFTLLDIHPESIESAKGLLDALGLAGSIARCEALDAASYRAGDGSAPDVILLEMLQAGLETEPQVALTRHLLAQAPEAVLIPEEVRVELVLVDPAREFASGALETNGDETSPGRLPVGSVFVLNREAVRSWQSLGDRRLPGSVVRIPDSIERRFQPMLCTTIRVYRSHVVGEYESGLTHPRAFVASSALEAGDTVRFHYRLGSRPGLVGEVAGRLDGWTGGARSRGAPA